VGDGNAKLLTETLNNQQIITGINQLPVRTKAFAKNFEPPSTVLEPDKRVVEPTVTTHGFDLSPVAWISLA
jgi:hypothetical protein